MAAANQGLVPGYLGTIPSSANPQDGTCTGGAAGTNAYVYSVAAGQTVANYTLTFCLGAETGGYPAGVHTLTAAGIQ
jgi:hypothetical protein